MRNDGPASTRFGWRTVISSRPVAWARAGAPWFLIAVSLLVEVLLAFKPGLWRDEVFSLALATGHAIEQPLAEERNADHDFIWSSAPRLARYWRSFAEQDTPPAPPIRVIRASLISDTHPPLYLLALNTWFRIAGASDAALRLFSLLWAVGTLPIVFRLGSIIGGDRAGWLACLFFALAPLQTYYATEGRMYSMIMFLASALAWATLRLHLQGQRPLFMVAWVFLSVAGLMTNYFFAFPAAAFCAWLLLWPGLMPRRLLSALYLVTVVLIAPWYVRVSALFGQWRVTGDWLKGSVGLQEAFRSGYDLTVGLFLGIIKDHAASPFLDHVQALVVIVMGIVAVAGSKRLVPRPVAALMIVWFMSGIAGVLLFSVLLSEHADKQLRYVLAGLPAAMILVAYVAARAPGWLRVSFIGVTVLAWGGNTIRTIQAASRQDDYRAIDAAMAAAQPDLVVVNSTPAGIIGAARYLRPDIPMAGIVTRLHQPSDADLSGLLEDHCVVVVADVHPLPGAPATALWPFMARHAQMQRAMVINNKRVGVFRVREGCGKGSMFFFEKKNQKTLATIPNLTVTEIRPTYGLRERDRSYGQAVHPAIDGLAVR